MSTRATIHFHDVNQKGKPLPKPTAIIYRHSVGYPDGLGEDLKKFINIVRESVKDTRFGDASYLAAKWVVWDAAQMAASRVEVSKIIGKPIEPNPLDFLSVGIMAQDPGDIEYRYKVICDGKPTVKTQEVN